MTAVLHEEENHSKHLHILIPRIELTTEKSLNIAPPRHRHYFDPLRDYFNYKYGWARPDDPARARTVQLQDHLLKQNATALKAELIEQPKATRIELINQFIEHRMLQGVVFDRTSVLNALSEIGKITRIGQQYISLQTEAGTDRLKAVYYHEQFHLANYLEDQSRTAATRSTSTADPSLLEQWHHACRAAEQRIQTLRSRRQQYNEKTYRDPEPTAHGTGHDHQLGSSAPYTFREELAAVQPTRHTAAGTNHATESNSATDSALATTRNRDTAAIEKVQGIELRPNQRTGENDQGSDHPN